MMAAARRREQKPQRPTGSRPGMDGRYEEGEREITGPQEIIAGERVGTQQRKYKVKVNVRASTVDHMRAHGRLDATQHEACKRFQKIWECAGIGRSRGVNFEAGRSEGSVGDPFTDEMVHASHAIEKMMPYFGQYQWNLLTEIVGEDTSIKEMARRYSADTERLFGKSAQGYISGALMEAIDGLVHFWRMEAKGQPARRPEYYNFRGKRMEVSGSIRATDQSSTGPAREISIGKFGDTLIEEKRPSEQPRGHTSGNIGSRPRRGK